MSQKLEEILRNNSNISLTLSLQDLRVVVREIVDSLEQTTEPDEDFLDSIEASKLLKVEKHTLRRYVDRGLIPRYKISEFSRKNLYKKSEVLALAQMLKK